MEETQEDDGPRTSHDDTLTRGRGTGELTKRETEEQEVTRKGAISKIKQKTLNHDNNTSMATSDRAADAVL